MIYKQRTAAHRIRTARTEGGGVVVALKKSDLYSSPWKGADELRGGMDASQCKDYALTLLFLKYVTYKSKSGKSKSDKNSLIDFPSGGSFDNLVTFKDDKEIGDKTNKAISKLAEGDGLLGDAYEYLMLHFATESGKSKGQFYTPYSATVYDPTCGSGSLLLKAADAAPRGLTIYGQEKENATWALAKKHPACLEYILVHEMAHFHERNHNYRFVELMDTHLPNWRAKRDELDGAPLAKGEWI